MANALGGYLAMLALGAGLGLPLAVLGCGIGQGLAGGKALEGIARQPEAAGRIQMAMIIALALIESLAIYALLVSLIIVFVVGLPKGDAVMAVIQQAGAAGGGAQ
jgi:F-type H+-transporting ATPase subunit c